MKAAFVLATMKPSDELLGFSASPHTYLSNVWPSSLNCETEIQAVEPRYSHKVMSTNIMIYNGRASSYLYQTTEHHISGDYNLDNHTHINVMISYLLHTPIKQHRVRPRLTTMCTRALHPNWIPKSYISLASKCNSDVRMNRGLLTSIFSVNNP